MTDNCHEDSIKATDENEISDFLKSNDFMKLGQAISHRNWQIAVMTAQRMQKEAARLGLDAFARQLTGIRQCAMQKQEKQAKDILALIIAKRVQMIKTVT